MREPAAVGCVGCGRDKFLLTTSGARRAGGEEVLGGIFFERSFGALRNHNCFSCLENSSTVTVNGIESDGHPSLRMNGGHERNVRKTIKNTRR